jgi:hypothetical protein
MKERVIRDGETEILTLAAHETCELGPGMCFIRIGRMQMSMSPAEFVELGQAALNLAAYALPPRRVA